MSNLKSTDRLSTVNKPDVLTIHIPSGHKEHHLHCIDQLLAPAQDLRPPIFSIIGRCNGLLLYQTHSRKPKAE